MDPNASAYVVEAQLRWIVHRVVTDEQAGEFAPLRQHRPIAEFRSKVEADEFMRRLQGDGGK